MKTFKLIDVIISMALILASSFLVVIDCLSEAFTCFYIITGTWHIISMLIHTFAGWFTSTRSPRHFYHYAAAIIVLLLPITLMLAESSSVPLVVILVIAAPMGIFYTNLCYTEYKKIERPLSKFK